jgi:predicted dehydrogenase
MKFGLIGAGSIGAIRGAALARTPGASLVGIFDLDEQRARAAAPGAQVLPSAEALIESPDVDAIIISTPPPTHEELAIAAFAAGKHVLVEKPMAPTIDACQRMATAAETAGKLLTVGYNHRYFEALKLIRDVAHSGTIGTITHVRAYTGHVGLAEFKAPWMYDAAVMGGGALFDNGTHLIDLVRYIAGDFADLYAQLSDKVWHLPEVEDNAQLLARSMAGAALSIEASWSEWRGYRFHIDVHGDRGMARAYYAPMMATVITLDKPGGTRNVKRHFYPRAILREKIRGWQSTVIQTFVEEFTDFMAVAGGAAGSGRIARATDGIRAVQIGKAAHESQKTGARVLIGAAPA